MAKNINPKKEALQNTTNSANSNDINSRLLDNFKNTENIEQTYKSLNHPYFSWEESLINKLTENNPNMTFNDIKNLWINLGTLSNNTDWDLDFRKCLNNIKNNEIKKCLIQELFDKIQFEIWTETPYDDFSTECKTSKYLTWSTSDVISYYQKVIDYLKMKEIFEWGWKTENILKNLRINNEDINSGLLSWKQIPNWISLKDDSIPSSTKEAFDALLSFELSKGIQNKINTANDISNKTEALFTNTFPAINTVIGEDEKYKYDENNFWKEYQSALKAIKDDKDLDISEKWKHINNLKWTYYIKHLKDIDPTIGDTIEKLYNNNFDYSKLDEDTLKNYLDKIIDLRLKSFKNGINEILESTLWDIDFDRFSKFYKELADPNAKEMHLSLPGVDSPTEIGIPIEKSILSNKNLSLKDIDEFWTKAKSNDCIPFQYKIKKQDIEKLNISEEDKKNLMNMLSEFIPYDDKDNYIINWKDVWNLIYLFFAINGKISKSQLNTEKEKEVEKTLWDIQKNNEETEEKSEEEKRNEIENFIKKIEWRWSWSNFENWSEIWLPMWNSELPWKWYQRMKIKISNLDKEKWTFTWKVFGWELKFSKKLEWKSRQFTMNEETLNEIKKVSKDSEKIRLLSNPDKSDFNSYKNKLNGKLWTWALSFPEWIKWNGEKFMHNFTDKNWQEVEKEVKHFWVPWDDSVSYKIEYDPSNRSFKVSTTYNWEEKNNDWKSENVRFSYSRDMDRNNFLIFFTQKWLTPQSEEDSKKAQIKQEKNYKIVNWWSWKLNRFSINNFKNVSKAITWSIKKKIEDYNKSQEEKLQDILIWDRWLYGKLSHVLWFIPSIKNWLSELEKEYYNDRDNRTWKKIKTYYEDFCKDYDLADTFDQEPPYIKMKWKWSLKNQILARVENASDIMWDPWIYQAAWLLLANIEKWWSAYRWLSWHENEWLWVKALLGNAHYQNFLKQKQNIIDLFEKEENKDKLQDALANSEMTYIINNVYWKDWWLLLWGIEMRWIPGNTKKTNYIENPAKNILSEQFAKKLDELTKNTELTKDNVTNKMPKHNYFEKSENDFYRLIKSSRFSGAMSELEGMISLARTDSQIYATKKCYLILMLSGILDFNWNKWLRKFAYTQWKTFGFAPAMLAKNLWHSEEIASLLDDFSEWDFTKHVTAYCHKEDLLKWKTDIGELIKQVNGRFNEKKMEEFDNYVESIPWRNWESKSKALQSLQKDLTDYNNQNPDDIVLKNAKLINSAWLNASADAVSTRRRIENWEFRWKDQDEKNDMAAFWKSCSEKIENAAKNLDTLSTEEWTDRANKILDKYLWWFWISWDSKQEVYKWINTAYHYHNEIEKTKRDYCLINQTVETFNKEWEKIDINVPLWKLDDNDVKKILRYWLEWFIRTHRLSSQQLPTELKTALDNFQNFFEKALYKGYFSNISDKINSDDKKFDLWWWNVYENIAQKDNNQGFFSDEDNDTVDSTDFKGLDNKTKKSLLRKIFNSENYKNSDMHIMRKSLKNHWVSLSEDWSLFNDTNSNKKSQQCS